MNNILNQVKNLYDEHGVLGLAVALIFVLVIVAAMAESHAIAECVDSGGIPQYETEIIYIQNGNIMHPMPIEVYAGCKVQP